MEIAKTTRQFCHRHNPYTDLILAQPLTFMIALVLEKQIEFLMHCRCHVDLSKRYFTYTPPSSHFSTSTTLRRMASLLSKPKPAAIVGAFAPPKIIGAT